MSSFLIKTTYGNTFSSIQGGSVLDSALKNNLVFEYSCKNGQCGVCKTSLLSGKVAELKPQLGLSLEEQEDGKFLTCCCEAKSDILIDSEDLSALHGIEVKTTPARINSLKKLSPNVVEVRLRLPPTANFKFLEGQYIDVIGPNAVRRSYSIASSSFEKEITLLIKKVEGGVLSEYWFNQAKGNDLLRLEGPKGTFYVRENKTDIVLLATGTGIAPIISILERLDADDSFEQMNDIYLFWGNRHSEDFVWKPEFKRLKVNVSLVLSGESDEWEGDRGYVQEVALTKIDDFQQKHVYACGSNEMILTAKKMLMEQGLPEKQFYSDAFVQSF
ncbi:FAD-binding oxidoreductase [Thiomicrorhabdus sp. ZW0627]|uniref:FAD-binding oxidoreductase n=1 Tax=Thiomicrorhabdus sp. ZW0627 TaxID=3039774 RepID=UPI002436B2E9|nr:FAD-binding oxidoreductase [Thiomicrorhabdus sp. ZW0627]MDG6773627.1 FAD-binding oxidoreductase [Thiomicrorhabdus sp. ZW0627]